jgi:lysophospholipase L1-like esterase
MTRNGVIAVVLLVVGVVALAHYTAGPKPPGDLLVVGDSLSAQSQEDIRTVLNADGWTTTVTAEPGSGIAGGGERNLDWSKVVHDKVAKLDPEVVYIELGTNGCGPNCTSVRGEIDAIMRELQEVPVVLWLDVRTNVPLPNADPPAINREIEAATLRYPNLTRLDFDEWGSADPELLVGDGVHFNTSGEVVMADQVRAAVREHTGT